MRFDGSVKIDTKPDMSGIKTCMRVPEEMLKRLRVCRARSRLDKKNPCEECKYSDGYGRCFYTKDCAYKRKSGGGM